MEVKDGLWDKKKEDACKGEGICKRDEGDIWESKGGVEKITEGNEKHVDRNRKEAVEYKVGDKVLLSTKNLTWQIRNREIKKLMKKFVRLYKIKKIISENVVELELPVSMKIHLVVDVSRIVLY